MNIGDVFCNYNGQKIYCDHSGDLKKINSLLYRMNGLILFPIGTVDLNDLLQNAEFEISINNTNHLFKLKSYYGIKSGECNSIELRNLDLLKKAN